MTRFDHPIFLESIRLIQTQLGHTTGLDPLQQKVLERLIHSSGDFEVRSLLSFSPGSCQLGLSALKAGATILTDTFMLAAGVKRMAQGTLASPVRTVLDWAPEEAEKGLTRTALGMQRAWLESVNQLQPNCAPIVAIGSAPTALEALLDLVDEGAPAPSLIIGMPVGFVGVVKCKSRLSGSGLPNICLNGTRGGAGLAASVVNALLRASIDS